MSDRESAAEGGGENPSKEDYPSNEASNTGIHRDEQERIDEDIQTTSFETADVEEMSLELVEAKLKVDSEALTSGAWTSEALPSMVDSTMKDILGSTDVPDGLEIRCCIERVKVNHSTSTPLPSSGPFFRDLEHDSKVIVPSETAVCDLVQTVLRRFQYSEVDLLGARGMIVVKNWKPMTLESITDDPLVSVGDLLSGLSTLVTLKIQLRCLSKFRLIDDFKEKLLFFLLSKSRNLLQSSGCPIIQTAFEEILGETSNLPEDLRNQFNKWYDNQIHERGTRPSSTTNGTSSIREEPQEHGHDLSEVGQLRSTGRRLPAAARPRGPSLGRLWLDRDGERVRSKNHHPKDRLTSRRQDQHRGKYQEGLQDDTKATSFECFDAFTYNRSHTTLNSNNTYRQRPTNANHSPSARTTQKDETEADPKLEISPRGSDDEERVPELPNRNAVYVIRPLPISSPGSESMEIILTDSDVDSNDDQPFLPPAEPQDLSKTVSSSTAANDKNRSIHPSESLTVKTFRDHIPSNMSQRKASDSQPNLVVSDRKNVPQSGDFYDQTYSKRVDIFTSDTPRTSRICVDPLHDDNDINNHSNDSFFPSSDLFSPNNHQPQGIPPAFGILSPTLRHHHHHHHQQQIQQQTASHLLALSHTMNFMRRLHGPPLPIHQPFQDCMGENGDSDQRKRSRVFIDPISETPKLEEWFTFDSHPSTATIEEFTNELNRSVYRQRFPRLEPKNVQLWFKNHRAKVKRLKGDGGTNGLRG